MELFSLDSLLAEQERLVTERCVERCVSPPAPELFCLEKAPELTAWLRQRYSRLFDSATPESNRIARGIPKGNWYMITVTSLGGSTRDDMLLIHQQFVDYMTQRNKGIIVHTVLEKAGEWHTHSAVNLSASKKNLERDLRKHLGVLVKIDPKVTTLKRWNGLCNYVLKRTYTEKSETVDSHLIDGIGYEPTQGYYFKK